MISLWPLYLSFIIFTSGTVIFSVLSVWLGYFANPTQNIIPLAVAAAFCALFTLGIGESIAKRVSRDKDEEK